MGNKRDPRLKAVREAARRFLPPVDTTKPAGGLRHLSPERPLHYAPGGLATRWELYCPGEDATPLLVLADWLEESVAGLAVDRELRARRRMEYREGVLCDGELLGHACSLTLAERPLVESLGDVLPGPHRMRIYELLCSGAWTAGVTVLNVCRSPKYRAGQKVRSRSGPGTRYFVAAYRDGICGHYRLLRADGTLTGASVIAELNEAKAEK